MRIDEDHLTINRYSRPGTMLKDALAIVMHWVANPGSSAQANRNFFEGRKDGKSGYGSAHYIVGLHGEIIECIPPTEVAWHCGSKTYTAYTRTITRGNPNYVTLGVELCHPRADGEFSGETLKSAVSLVASLCNDFDLNPYKTITTHKAIVGWKDCPKYWCDNPGEFQRFCRLVWEEM